MLNRTEFDRVTPESVGIPSETIEWLLDQLESGFTEPHSLMVMRQGKICAEGWWNPYAPGIRHGEQSHSKTYAATAVGAAYTEGLLSLDEKLIDIFPEDAPENPSENLQKLTVHDVLCMGCGMDTMPGPSDHWIRDFLYTPVLHTPGTTFMYNSVGSSILAAVIKKKTGMGLHAYLKSRVYDKIGILSDNHRWYCYPDGTEVGGGGLLAATEDNLRLMKLYADGGVWDGEQILAADYVAKATTLQNASATEQNVNPEASDNFLGYGYQIWMCKPEGVYRADGAMGQFTIVIPDKNMIIAITENASGAHWAQKTLDTIWKFLEMVPSGDSIPEKTQASSHLKSRMERLCLPRVPFAPYSPLMESFEGDYRVTGGRLSFESLGGGNFMSGDAGPSGISGFCLRFLPDELVMTAETIDGESVRYDISTDGSRRWNALRGIVSQALMSGYFQDENTFVIKVRWIETCNEMDYFFRFDKGNVHVHAAMPFFSQTLETDVTAVKAKEHQ